MNADILWVVGALALAAMLGAILSVWRAHLMARLAREAREEADEMLRWKDDWHG